MGSEGVPIHYSAKSGPRVGSASESLVCRSATAMKPQSWTIDNIFRKLTSWRCLTCWPVKLWRCKITSLVNKSADWTPTYHKILIFFSPKSLKSLCADSISGLTDSNEPAMRLNETADFRMRLKCLCHKGSVVLGIHTIGHRLVSTKYLNIVRDAVREASKWHRLGSGTTNIWKSKRFTVG